MNNSTNSNSSSIDRELIAKEMENAVTKLFARIAMEDAYKEWLIDNNIDFNPVYDDYTDGLAHPIPCFRFRNTEDELTFKLRFGVK